MIKVTKNLKIELITFSTYSRLIIFTFSTNEKRYIKHNNICARRRHNVEIILRKTIWKSQAQLDFEKKFSSFFFNLIKNFKNKQLVAI